MIAQLELNPTEHPKSRFVWEHRKTNASTTTDASTANTTNNAACPHIEPNTRPKRQPHESNPNKAKNTAEDHIKQSHDPTPQTVQSTKNPNNEALINSTINSHFPKAEHRLVTTSTTDIPTTRSNGCLIGNHQRKISKVRLQS